MQENVEGDDGKQPSRARYERVQLGFGPVPSESLALGLIQNPD